MIYMITFNKRCYEPTRSWSDVEAHLQAQATPPELHHHYKHKEHGHGPPTLAHRCRVAADGYFLEAPSVCLVGVSAFICLFLPHLASPAVSDSQCVSVRRSVTSFEWERNGVLLSVGKPDWGGSGVVPFPRSTEAPLPVAWFIWAQKSWVHDSEENRSVWRLIAARSIELSSSDIFDEVIFETLRW